EGSSSHSSRITPHELRIDLPISSSDFLPPASCKNVCSSIVSESCPRGVIAGKLGQQFREFQWVLRLCRQACTVRNQFPQCRQVGDDNWSRKAHCFDRFDRSDQTTDRFVLARHDDGVECELVLNCLGLGDPSGEDSVLPQSCCTLPQFRQRDSVADDEE